ncbi:hypothetical protein KQY27_06445 [Methanobrevibacter sp. TMH8]|uniref:hypothetical protein n=1 Tax=Methanobrevibacter sp. TMH8 TaxID=2848611 RepID=UPI001CCEFE0E|nr:hypothetical protein [Methanobrevibacter sp. TMH8]MBZ9571178.1 hypothetical protein [Methanobrevibacter sp. TMH8]
MFINITFRLLFTVNILDIPCASRITLSLVFPVIVMFLLIPILVLLLPVYVPSSSSIVPPATALVSAPLIPPEVVLLMFVVAANPACELIIANKIILAIINV